jgi:hypothetical protein
MMGKDITWSEMYSPQHIDPEKRNVYIWSAHNLKEVRNLRFFLFLIVGAWLECCVGVDNVIGFF